MDARTGVLAYISLVPLPEQIILSILNRKRTKYKLRVEPHISPKLEDSRSYVEKVTRKLLYKL